MAILSSIFLSHTKFKTIAEQEDNLQRLILTTIFGIVAMVFIAYAEKLASHNETGLIERGNYLVTTMGCGDCHTPWEMGANGPKPDSTRLLSGHPEHALYPMWSPADFQRNAIALVNPTNTAWAGGASVSRRISRPTLQPASVNGKKRRSSARFARVNIKAMPMRAISCRPCRGRHTAT